MLLGILTVGICMYFAPPAAASAAACAPPPAPIPAPSASLGPAAALASATVHEKAAEYPQSFFDGVRRVPGRFVRLPLTKTCATFAAPPAPAPPLLLLLLLLLLQVLVLLLLFLVLCCTRNPQSIRRVF